MIAMYYTLLMLLSVPILIMFIVMATSDKYRKYLVVFIPIILALVFKLIYAVDTIKAHPKSNLPADYFFLSSFEIPQKTIYLWIIEKGKDTPHTVQIPWTQKDSKATQEAKKSLAEGTPVAGKRKEKSADDETGELLLYQFQLKDHFKK